MCPLFYQDCVDAGSHVIPLFSGSPPEAFLKMLNNRGATPLLVKFAVKKELAKPIKTGAVLKLQVIGWHEEKLLLKTPLTMVTKNLWNCG